MPDDVLNNYVNKLINKDIDNDIFEEYIDIFSKFLGYVNSDYKYNGTYLSQYIDDFKKVCTMLKKKNEIYNEILEKIKKLESKFELIIDRMFYVDCTELPKVEIKYIGIDKNMIVKCSVEIKIIFEFDGNKHIFCKEYMDYENDLAKRIYEDTKKFIEIKS